nr:hypothetical protein [Janibacter melonis]
MSSPPMASRTAERIPSAPTTTSPATRRPSAVTTTGRAGSLWSTSRTSALVMTSTTGP